MDSNYFPHRSPRRSLLGVLGIGFGCLPMAAVIALFWDASQMDWLSPTPAHELAMARCERVVGTRARQACAASVVAEVKSQAAGWRTAQAGARATFSGDVP